MLLGRPTGLAVILPKTIHTCLNSAPPLLYNWRQKLHGLVLGICLSRSLVLQDIAQTRWGKVKTSENLLSGFLGQKRLNLRKTQKACAIHALKSYGKRRFWVHDGKMVIIIDSTGHAKARSRGKKRPMPKKGKVRLHNLPSKETILVPGYQELWVGVLMADRKVLPITRRLWTENGPDCASLNLVEISEIRKARELIKEAFKMDVILVADSGFKRKDLLHWLKKVEGMDYVIRIEGKLIVQAEGYKGLLSNLAPWWPNRLRMQWRARSKWVILSDVSTRRVSVLTESKESVSFNVAYLTPVNAGLDPMFLATTLTTASTQNVITIVRFYSWRWGIETFLWMFKNGLKADSWRVFSCWEAIDNLLAAAHMAFLALALLAELCRRGQKRALRSLLRQMKDILRSRFARPPEMTLGRFFQLIAMDFPNPRQVGVPL